MAPVFGYFVHETHITPHPPGGEICTITGKEACHQPSLKPDSLQMRMLSQDDIILDFSPSGSSGSGPVDPPAFSHLIAFFLDWEASICQPSSALQTPDWPIVRQLAPPASNLPHKAAARQNGVLQFACVTMTYLLERTQFSSKRTLGGSVPPCFGSSRNHEHDLDHNRSVTGTHLRTLTATFCSLCELNFWFRWHNLYKHKLKVIPQRGFILSSQITAVQIKLHAKKNFNLKKKNKK